MLLFGQRSRSAARALNSKGEEIVRKARSVGDIVTGPGR